jgi:hypothetical protein
VSGGARNAERRGRAADVPTGRPPPLAQRGLRAHPMGAAREPAGAVQMALTSIETPVTVEPGLTT